MTRTPPETATPTLTGTITRTPTVTSTPTPTSSIAGPLVTFFGIVPANGCYACSNPFCECLLEPTRTPVIDEEGRQVFLIGNPTGFLLVVEARPGSSGSPVGSTVPPPTPGRGELPDLQILTSQPLGNGSPAVCDTQPVAQGGGGVPGSVQATFDGLDVEAIDRLVDFACRFEPRLPNSNACTLASNGEAGAISGTMPSGSLQFCHIVSGNLAFPIGDTVLTVRARDRAAARNAGPARSIVVRRVAVLP